MKTKWFEIRNASAESADVYLYDEISPYIPGHNALDVVTQLNNLTAKRINVRINSPGGSVFDGMAIYNALARRAGEVITFVDGVAASIASVIAMAGKEVHMADNAMLMIHDPAAFVFGQAGELRKQADVLDQIKETIINVYHTRTGSAREAIAACMAAETWFTASEALEAKLATNVDAAMKLAACFDFKAFKYQHVPELKQSSSTTPRSLLQRKLALFEKE